MAEDTQLERFHQIALPHLDAAYNLARWLAGNSHDAEDITQEAFLRALRFFDGFRGGEDARTWILKIVRNTYYTQWRRSRSRGESTEFDEEMHTLGAAEDALESAMLDDANPEAAYARKQQAGLLDRALMDLPDEFREALVLREVEDLSYKEIAAALSIPMGTVMSRLSRGRKLLAAAFRRLADGPREGISREADASSRVMAFRRLPGADT